MPEALQLYEVEVTRELLVLARSRADAERLARKVDDDPMPDVHASEMRCFPGDWEGGEIPYGERDESDPNRTVDQWIALGAAPHYRTEVKP